MYHVLFKVFHGSVSQFYPKHSFYTSRRLIAPIPTIKNLNPPVNCRRYTHENAVLSLRIPPPPPYFIVSCIIILDQSNAVMNIIYYLLVIR